MSEREFGWNGAPATPPPRTEPPVPADTISQATLANYMRLCDLVKRRDDVRRRLLERLAAGAAVEPGPLTADVRTIRSRRLSATKLADLIGVEVVETYLDKIVPTVSRQLNVKPASGRPAAPNASAPQVRPAIGPRNGVQAARGRREGRGRSTIL